MSQVEWYLQKAQECRRMANDATDKYARTKFESERKLWLKIAADIKKAEAPEFIYLDNRF